jgi:1,2-diacylglycerol 3-beta-galactosyltransferase
MAITGLPVHPRFAAGLIAKTEARQKLGWDAELPAIVFVGGGSGMGRMQELAAQINTLDQPLQLIVVAGRNAALKASLEAVQWKHRTAVYGFMTNMPELMAAADVLVTKAGPATISEACMAGLPIILSDAIPGQEYGNVKYLTENGAGVYANTPEKVRATLSQWLARGKGYLEERSKAALKIATPDAVWTIVDEIMKA